MYEIWLSKNGYIQGVKKGSEEELSDAIKKAKAILAKAGVSSPIRHERAGKDTWLDDAEGMPVGVIVEVED